MGFASVDQCSQVEKNPRAKWVADDHLISTAVTRTGRLVSWLKNRRRRSNDELFRKTFGQRNKDPDRRRSSGCSRRISDHPGAAKGSENRGPGSRRRRGLPALRRTLSRRPCPRSADAKKGWSRSGDRVDVTKAATADHRVDQFRQ